MKKAIALLLALVMLLSLAACGGGNTTSGNGNDTQGTQQGNDTPEGSGLTEEQCIGTWEWSKESTGFGLMGIETLELYKGGTGKGYASYYQNGQYAELSWQITDDLLKVSLTSDPSSLVFELDGNTAISTDGENIYIKQ